jgi:hypothetical protein
MNEQLLKDFIATAQKYNYNWNKAFGLFPELKGYDQQVLKDYVATAEKFNYNYKKVNSLFPELGFGEPSKKKEPTASASNLEKPTSGSSSRWDDVTEEPISQKKVRTEDYLDKVQNAQRKAKAPTQKVESTFEQPKETKPPVKFDVLSEKEAMQMMAEDFGKKEFEAYSSIEKIPSANKLKDLDEQTTANILNKQFEGTNLKFEKSGSQLTVTSKIGYGINSTVLNEKTIDLSDPNADKELKSFVSNNLVKKSEREQFENAQSVEDLVELVGSNPNKFNASILEGMDTDRYFERQMQMLEGEMARAKAETYDADLKSYEQAVIKFNQEVKSGKMSKDEFNERASQLENQRNLLQQRQAIIANSIKKANNIDKLSNNLLKANIISKEEREKQGSFLGNIGRGYGEGLTDTPQNTIDFAATIASAFTDAKTFANTMAPGEYDRLKRLGYTDDEIKNEIQKSIKNRAIKVLKSVPDAFGAGTTEEYSKSSDRSILEQALYAIAESTGAAMGGVGLMPSSAGVAAGFFAMSYNALEDQMRGPQFDALTENEKKIMSVPYGLVIGQLEKLGLKVATSAAKNKTLAMFSDYIITKTFSSLPKNASLLEIKSAIDKSVAASVANGMIKITGAGLVEGGTEFTQQIFEGIEKDVANRIIQSNQLDAAKEEGGGTVSKEIYDKIVENKFFKDAADLTTSEGISDLLNQSANAFAVGALAGGLGGGFSVGIADPIANKISNNKFAIYRDVILNDPARAGAISSINRKVDNQEITREEADKQINDINESYSALRQIPSSFSLSSQREAFGLLREKDKLQKEIDGKDPSLVAKQKDRIAEIETQLKGLSYAVQEQSTDAIPVQPTTGVGGEMAQGAPETGLKETAQKGQEEVDQYIADMGAEARIGSVINPIMDKMANAEYINDNDIDNAITTIFNEVEQLEKSDKYSPETKAAISDKLLNIAEKLDNYEFRTKTETVEVTKAGATTATRKTSEAVRKIRAEKYFNAVQATVNGQEVTLQDKNGRVEAPMPNGEVIVLDTPSMEIAEGGFEFDENDALVSVTVNDRLGNTVKLTGDQALDFAIRDRENKLGVVEQAEFDEAYQEVETRYVKEAKPAEAPVAEAAVVAEAEPTAEPVATEAVIGDIEVTEVPAVEETMDEIDRLNNILTAEDFNEVNLSDKKTNKVAAQITKAAKAISKVLPKVKFVVHSTPEAFVEATKSLDGRASEGGIYDHNTKTIHINLKNANSRTVAHEVFHALILSKVASDAEASRLTRSMIKAVIKSLKQAEGGADIISFLEDFESDYEANIQNEEKLSELFAILSDNYKKLPPATKNIIVRFLERMAKLVGIKPMTSGEVIQFMNVLSAKVEAGEVITEQEIGEQQQAGKTKTRKQIIGEKGAERLDAMESNTRRMSNLVMAKNMTDDGKSPLEIRVATGWELGSDGKWRYETVDNIPYLKDTVKQVNEFLADNKDADSIEQKAYFFLPPELIKMYPELNDITIEFGRGNEKEGSYSPLLKLIRVNVGVYPKNTVSVLLHEVQHAIQEIEGFDSGASMDRLMTKFVDREKGLSYRIKRLKGRGGNEALLEKAINDYREFVANFAIENNGKKILNAFNLYNRKSGEVEARNVQDRMNMTEEERRKTLLSETAEVKKPQQIFSENMFQPRKQKINALSEKSKEIIKSNYEDSFGFNDFDWNKESNRKDFSQWLKTFEENQFKKNLPKVIKEVESDIELLKKRKIVELKLKGFEELIIPTLGNEVLVPELSLYEESILMNPSATIESLEKGFKEAKNIIDEDGSINKYKTTPSNLFKGDDISLPNFERFIQKNPEYTGVFNDWKKIFDEDIELTLKNTYAFRYPNLEQLEYLHKELKEIQKNEQEFAPRKQKIKTTIDEFDGETTVTLDGKKIGKMFYDRSQRAWVNAEFDKTSSKPYTSKWIYGDVLGDTKAEAINELIKRNSEEKAEAKVEEPKKVTQYTEDQIINEFLTALNDKGNIQRSPIGKEFIYGDKAFLEFSRFDKETGSREISLQSIASIDKGQGAGKEVMKDITDTADELGITLTLDAKPFGDTGLSKKALIKFYEKNGFVPDLEEAFGGEFETEEELIDYVLENEREALPMVREPKQKFAPRKQKNSVDRLVNEGKEQGKTDQEIRQDATAAGFTQKEISSALAKYYAKGEGIFTRSGKTGVTTRLYEGAKKLAQQYLTSKGLMPKIGFNLKERMEGEISKEANRAVNTAKKFGKLFDKYKGDKEALLEAFDKYIRGEKRVKLPAKFVGIANEMRNHIDTLSEMLINNGAVTGEMADTIQQNLGSYLSRSYEIYDNKNWKKKVGDQLVNQARNFLRTQPGTIAQAQADATAQNIPFNEALDNLVDNKIEDLFAEVQTEGFFKGSKVGAKDLSTLKFRQDIPEQIRMLMGEYTDPAMNYARTVNKLIHLAAQHKFLSDMREAGLGKFFFEKNDSLRPIGYNTQIAAKGSEVMAPLNGLYTTPEIFEAFQKQFNQKEIGAVMTFLYRVMGITKWLKTIASAATHMKNVFSNIGFVMANGHNILKLGPAIKVVANDLRTMSKPEVQAKIDEYIEAGIMRQGAGINEIRDMFKDANLDRFLEKRLSLKQPKGLMSKVKRAIGAPFIGFKTIAEALYQAEDDMFKIAAYENEVARYANSWYNKKPADLTEAERKIVVDKAADNVKNTYPTYSRIPEGIKQLRKFPLFIGSFISFQAESYRTAFNTIALAKEELLSGNKKLRTIGASRIAGASAYLTIKNAILSHFGMALGTGLSGVIGALYDDDDEKKKEEDVREFLPPWSKDSDIIPIKKSDGTIEYIDFSASDPHGALNKALNAFFRGDDLLDSFSKGLLATVEPFVGPDITVGLAMQLANNENDFGGKIYNEEDTFAEKTRKIADFVYKVIEPGTITSVRKVWKDEQPLMNSLFGEATGMKIRPLEVKKQFEFKMDTYADEFAEIKRIYNSEYNKTLRMMEDPKVSKKELAEQEKKTEEAFNRANSLYAAKGKELMNLINAANRLGVDYDELIEVVKAKNVMNSTNLFEIQQDNPAQIEEKYY